VKSVHAKLLAIGTLTVIVALIAPTRQARSEAPEPRLVSPSWQFEFDYEKPRLILVDLPGKVEKQYYWYLPYTVTNRTGEDRLFIPAVAVMSNTGKIMTAGRKVSPAVFRAIKRHERNPLLQSPVDAIGKLLQGEDNAKDSVAIWPASEGDVDRYDLFIGGLSGETVVVKNPETDEMVVLRKSLHLRFVTPGTPAELIGQPIEKVDEEWVMR